LKYWRGFLVAAIVCLFSWLLMEFAATHRVLMDMFYPYVSRMIQTYLASWSSGVSFSLWQVIVTLIVVAVVATGVLMIVLRWNPVQWAGWVLAGCSIIFFVYTAVFGLNFYAGPLSEDVRLEVTDYTLQELESATLYFRDEAGRLAKDAQRDTEDAHALVAKAADGYYYLVHKESDSIFAGSMEPVKLSTKLKQGVAGTTNALTGESVVNLEAPTILLPYAACHEMAHRMCIAHDRDADYAAYLACRANPDPTYQYIGYLMAYRTCYNTLCNMASEDARNVAKTIHSGADALLRSDLEALEAFYAATGTDTMTRLSELYMGMISDEQPLTREESAGYCDLLVSWHIQEVVSLLNNDDDDKFDPLDETQVDISGIVNAKTED